VKLILTMKLDNAAFANDLMAPEIAGCLRRLGAYIMREGVEAGYRYPVLDINGNLIGHAIIEEE